MIRLSAAVRWDMVIQFRHGFYYVGGFLVVIWLALAVLSFTGGNGGITGFLWLAGAIAFAVSAISIGKSEGADAAEGATD